MNNEQKTMNKEQKRFEEVIKKREHYRRRMIFRKQLEILSRNKPRPKPVVKTTRKSWWTKLWKWIMK